jgi:DNA repair ATPase RecN
LIPIPISPDKLIDTADRLGAVDAVKRKLVKQPDPAAAKLVTVLEELSKIYGAMEEELTTYLSLFFDDSDPKQLARERAALARLEGGAIRARMEEARGRCSKIWNIYVRYLTPWFDRVLNPGESEQLRALFRELSEVDSQMVDAINDVASWLTGEALTTGDLVERNEFADANARVLAARGQLRPLRERIAEAMIQIRGLESEFIDISGAV